MEDEGKENPENLDDLLATDSVDLDYEMKTSNGGAEFVNNDSNYSNLREEAIENNDVVAAMQSPLPYEIDDNNADESDSDSDSSDSNNDLMEAQNLKKYNSLLEHLKANPFDYNSYTKLCDTTEELCDLDRLRDAYDLFANAFPLTAELWLKYLGVRIPLAQYDSERIEICKIFTIALRDYYSIKLAETLAEFLEKKETGIDQNLWFVLDKVYGLNYRHGHKIFALKRQSIANDEQLNQLDQLQSTLDVYRIELCYPLASLEDAYIDLRCFLEKNKAEFAKLAEPFDIDDIIPDYEDAKQLRATLQEYEKRLEHSSIEQSSKSEEFTHDEERPKIYFDYLEHLEKLCRDSDFDLTLLHQLRQTVFERLLSEFCLVPAYWLAYIDYVTLREDKYPNLKLPDVEFYKQTPLAITKRALRNCNAQELYIRAMQLCEMEVDCEESSVRELLERALAMGFQTPEPEVAIYLEYLSYLTRHTDYTNEEACAKLRKNFDWAWNYLGRRWGELADPDCEILQLWARAEYELFKSPTAARELWTTVMASSDNASKSVLWILYSQLEAVNNVAEAEKILCAALSQTKLDNPQSIASLWKLLARTHGSAVSLAKCYQRADALLQIHLEAQAAIKQNKDKQTAWDTREANIVKRNRKDVKRKAPPIGGDDVHDADMLPSKLKQSKIANNSKSANEQNESNEKPEIDKTKDNVRVFLSNIDYELNEEDVRKALESQLHFTNIELKRSSNGKSRGFGFMELENAAEVQKALKLDRFLINGRPIYISLVQREESQRKKFEYAVGKEPKKLFVKGLPSDCQQEEVHELFGAFGKIQEVRLVYHKSGKFKQIAFVEYENEADAGKATLATDKITMRGSTLTVAISNPPSRPNPAMNSLEASTSRANAAGLPRATAKPRMALIPTAVRQKLSTATSSSKAEVASNPNEKKSTTKMSNDDFRKLLMH